MPQQIEPDEHAASEARKHLSDALAAQLLTLDRTFKHTIRETVPGSVRFRHDVRLALTAQAQCRASLKILMALQRDEAAQKKSRNRANELLKPGIRPHDQLVAD